jgi:2-polyprenyl-3-methyl-5-hydroxy-6-metoxy-1,4-benzoquinol methylase
MMTSFSENIKPILEAIVAANPKKILDIGSGFGKFGILAREAILSVRAESGDLTPTDNLEVDCVEMAKYFQNQPYHEKLYQNHYHMDARNIEWEEMPKFDLVLLIDVVEHWSKEEAVKIIKEIKEFTGAKILISTPREVAMYEKDYYGIDCPKHESQWTTSDFHAINHHDIKDLSTIASYIFII